MRTADLPGIKQIKSDLIPPTDPQTGESSLPTGEVFRDAHGESHIVYVGHFVDLDATASFENRKPVINPEDGKQLTRKAAEGPYKVWHRGTVFVEEEFILERGPAEVRISRNFRPSETEVEQAEEAKLVQDFEKGLAKQAVKRGLTPGQLVDRIMGTLKSDPEPETTVPTSSPSPGAGEPEIIDLGSGWHNVKVDGELMSKKSLRIRDAEDLADKFRVPAGVGVEEEETEAGDY